MVPTHHFRKMLGCIFLIFLTCPLGTATACRIVLAGKSADPFAKPFSEHLAIAVLEEEKS